MGNQQSNNARAVYVVESDEVGAGPETKAHNASYQRLLGKAGLQRSARCHPAPGGAAPAAPAAPLVVRFLARLKIRSGRRSLDDAPSPTDHVDAPGQSLDAGRRLPTLDDDRRRRTLGDAPSPLAPGFTDALDLKRRSLDDKLAPLDAKLAPLDANAPGFADALDVAFKRRSFEDKLVPIDAKAPDKAPAAGRRRSLGDEPGPLDIALDGAPGATAPEAGAAPSRTSLARSALRRDDLCAASPAVELDAADAAIATDADAAADEFASLVATKRSALVRGSREWIFSAVAQWTSDAAGARVMALVGAGGTGKTCVSAEVLNRLGARAGAWHFAEHARPDASGVSALANSLSKMLDRRVRGYAKAAAELLAENGAPETDAAALRAALSPLARLPTRGVLVVVFDALDELPSRSLDVVLESLREATSLPNWVRIFVTSREDSKVERALLAYSPLRLRADEYRNKQDVKLVLTQIAKRYIDVDVSAAGLERDVEARFPGVRLGGSLAELEVLLHQSKAVFGDAAREVVLTDGKASALRLELMPEVRDDELRQPLGFTLDELYGHAAQARELLRCAISSAWDGKHAGEGRLNWVDDVIDPGLKKRPRANQKVKSDYVGDQARLKDICRMTFAFASTDRLIAALADHLPRWRHSGSGLPVLDVAQLKNRFANPSPMGYRDIVLNVTVMVDHGRTPHVVEVQLNLFKILQAKRVAHVYYDCVRDKLPAMCKGTSADEDELAAYIMSRLSASSLDAAVAALERKACGLMLYCTLLEQQLASAKMINFYQMADLPRGLGEVYDVQFKRAFPDGLLWDSLAKPLVEIVLTCYEPLNVVTISAVLGWDSAKQNDAVSATCHLFPERDGAVRLYHKTVSDWLLEGDHTFKVTQQRAHLKLGLACARTFLKSLGERPASGRGSFGALRRGAAPKVDLCASSDAACAVELEAAFGADVLGADELSSVAWQAYALRWFVLHLFHAGHEKAAIAALCSAAYVRARLLAASQGDADGADDAYGSTDETAPHDELRLGAVAYTALTKDVVEIASLCGDSALARQATALQDALVLAQPTLLSRYGRAQINEQLWQRLEPCGGGDSNAMIKRLAADLRAAAAMPRRFGEALTATNAYLVPCGSPLSLASHNNSVTAIATFRRDEAHLVVSASRDTTVKVWDAVLGGAPLATLRGHTSDVMAVAAFLVDDHGDGARIVSGGLDRTVRVWNSRGGAAAHVLRGHKGLVHAVACLAGHARCASAASDGEVRVWDAEKGVCLLAVEEKHDFRLLAIAAAEFVQTSGVTVRRLVGGGGGGMCGGGNRSSVVRVWDFDTGRLVGSLNGHTGDVLALVPLAGVALVPLADNDSASDRAVASASADGTVRIWDVSTCKEVCCLGTNGNASVLALAVVRCGGVLLSASSADGAIQVWDISKRSVLAQLQALDSPVEAVCCLADPRAGPGAAQIRVVGSLGNRLLVWRTAVDASASANTLGLPEGSHTKAVNAVTCYSPTLERSLSGKRRSSTGAAMASPFVSPSSPPAEANFTSLQGSLQTTFSKAPLVFSGGDDCKVKAWDVSRRGCCGNAFADDKPPTTVKGVAVFDYQCRPRLVSAHADADLRVWDGTSGALIGSLVGHSAAATAVVTFTLATGEIRAASASWDATVRIWDVQVCKAVAVLRGHVDGVTALKTVLLPSRGVRLVSGGEDRHLCWWDAQATGDQAPLASTIAHADTVTALAVLALDRPTASCPLPGVHIVSASNDCSLRCWDPTASGAGFVRARRGLRAALQRGLSAALPKDDSAMPRGCRKIVSAAHDLPITAVATYYAAGCAPRVVSASLDRTVRVFCGETWRRLVVYALDAVCLALAPYPTDRADRATDDAIGDDGARDTVGVACGDTQGRVFYLRLVGAPQASQRPSVMSRRFALRTTRTPEDHAAPVPCPAAVDASDAPPAAARPRRPSTSDGARYLAPTASSMAARRGDR